MVQLITWNDYGEGTMIEPTMEFGYTMLEHVQNFTGVNYDQRTLSSIFDQYQLRKKYHDDAEKNKMLDQTFYYFVSLQVDEAVSLIDSLQVQ